MTEETSVPTKEQFKQALLALRPLVPGHMKMLEAHFRAPNRQLTATQLAEAAGYSGYEGANMQYGMLGKAIATELSATSPMLDERGDPVWTGVIAFGTEGTPSSPHYGWTMRPELVAALTELPWGFTPPNRAADA